jgi:hypothetical protein
LNCLILLYRFVVGLVTVTTATTAARLTATAARPVVVDIVNTAHATATGREELLTRPVAVEVVVKHKQHGHQSLLFVILVSKQFYTGLCYMDSGLCYGLEYDLLYIPMPGLGSFKSLLEDLTIWTTIVTYNLYD